MSRRAVIWDGMGFPSARQGWMAALLASFLALFVLVSAVDAAACAPEGGSSQGVAASDLVVVSDAGHGKGGGAADPVACAHGHCHHSGTTLPLSPQSVAMTAAVAPNLLRPADEPLASRAPDGLERPPRA